MSKQEFEAILIVKIQDLLSLIKDKNGSFENAMRQLYQSKLYKILKNEEAKMWQLSTLDLYESLEVEKNDNTK